MSGLPGRKYLFLSGALGAMLWAAGGTVYAAAAPPNSPPDFSPEGVSWLAQGTDYKQNPGLPPMVMNDASHPHVINANAAAGEGASFRFADLNNPNLTDYAKAELKKVNDDVLRGKAVFAREARCWPTGVPTYDLNPAAPMYFIQTPKEVLLIWQMDHQVRHIYMNVPHSKNPKPSWYGESVGHYEGDTLVVDTIGQNTQTYVDNFRTPHSEALHVTERFHIVNDGKNLRAEIMIDDPAAFKQPLNVFQNWRRVADGPITESSCAESGQGYFSYDVEPVPNALTPDF